MADSNPQDNAMFSFFVENPEGKASLERRQVRYVEGSDEAQTVSWNWYDTMRDAHKQAFVVAKMAKADLLDEVHKSLQKAYAEGQTFEKWKKEIYPKLERRWIGQTVGELWDELSPAEKAKRKEPSEKEREKEITPKRLETIFRTNMRVANAAGHFQQLKATSDIYPFWRYVTRGDDRVRDEHRFLHNKVYRHDDPIWNVIFPPNGWNCRCHVSPMTERQVERKGLTIERGNFTADGTIDVGGFYVNIGKGWNYNPGDYLNAIEKEVRSNEKGRDAGIQQQVEADLSKGKVGKLSESEQKLLRQDIISVQDNAESIAESLKGTTLGIQNTIDKRPTKQAIKQGRKLLEFIRNYQPEGIADENRQTRIEELTKELQAAEHAHKRLNVSVKHTTAARQEVAKIQSELNDLVGDELTVETKERIRKLRHRLHRIKQLAKATDTRALRLEKSLDPNLTENIKQLATDSAKKALRIHGITSEYTLKDRCSLEHCISSREFKLLEQELKGLNSKEAANLRNEAATMLEQSQGAVKDATGGKSATEDLETLATSLRSAMQMRDLHEQAFALRIKDLPEPEQQRLRAKRQQVLDDRQSIQDANTHIFDRLPGATKEEIAIETMLMKRELDLMMYNMDSAELSFYRKFITARITDDKNDYLYDKETSFYDKDSDMIKCNFRRRDPRNECTSYYPRFNWYLRFHEEAHCLDEKLSSGSHVITFPDPENSLATKLLTAIQDDTLDFIKSACKSKSDRLSQPTSLSQCNKAEIKTAVLDYMAKNNISAEEFTTMLDAMGLASHGKIDRDEFSKLLINAALGYIKTPHSQKWPSELYGHPASYNTRDYKSEKHTEICDETSEVFADMTSVQWMPSDCRLRMFNERYLSESLGICREIMKVMLKTDAKRVNQ